MQKIEYLRQHYQDSAVAGSYDDERFTSFAGRTFNACEKRALIRALNRVRREIPHPSVLDVACGTGRIAECVLEQGLEVTAADISEEMMAVALQRCARFGDKIRFAREDMTNMTFPDGAFDVVTCFKVFHHFATVDRERILNSLARVANHFVIVSVSFSSPYYRLRRRVKRAFRLGTPRNGSTWADIRRETAAAGLLLVGRYWTMPLVSEDLVLLLRRGQGGTNANGQCTQ